MSNLVHNEQVSWLRRLREILEGRLHSALFLACDAGLLQIELSLDASARPVGLNGGSVLQSNAATAWIAPAVSLSDGPNQGRHPGVVSPPSRGVPLSFRL
jgi:hypothetical protein